MRSLRVPAPRLMYSLDRGMVIKVNYRNRRSSLPVRWAYPLLVLLAVVSLAVSAGPAVAVPITPQRSGPVLGVPQLLHSSPLAVPKAKLPAGGGASSFGAGHPQPKPVREIVADRTATTSTWRNSDGTLSVRSYLAPHFYKSASSGWQPIS